ncbi:MAG: HlyC/CorC family transporter [Deltaproteobacteria bacterium]|nr:MAG: HlyC/CorC family transporter [Deltaproteobacteria bacterium]
MTEVHPSLDFFGVAWRLGATLFFALLNGFFVAAEFALVKVRESRIEQLAGEGRRSARTAQHILRNLDRYLSACQLGITIASLMLGALGEPAVSAVLIAALGALGVAADPGAAWVPWVSIGLAFAIITTLHMTLGEQAPKMWALRRAEGIALRTARPLHAFAWLFGPFIVAVNAISNALLRVVGLRGDRGPATSPTAEEIRSILSLSARAGHISEHEHVLTANVFRMIELEVRHVVVPRVDVEFITLEHTLEENLERIRTSRNSRLPVCELGLDTILGFLHAKDVLDVVLRGESPDLRALVHPPLFVSDTMALSDFLLELQRERQHCAVVLDEHGTAIGLAFREDALEEIVGPLGDEFDDDVQELVKLSGGGFELSGRMSIPEVEDRLDFELSDAEDESEETIGGHVTALLGRLPKKGDAVRVGPYCATVIEVGRRRIARIRMTPAARVAATEAAPAPDSDT